MVAIPHSSGGNPELSALWFGEGPAVAALRVTAFLAIFNLQDFTEDLQALDTPLMAVALLLIHISLQVRATRPVYSSVPNGTPGIRHASRNSYQSYNSTGNKSSKYHQTESLAW